MGQVKHIKRGSKGIALVDVRNGRPGLRYVFDVADTQMQRNSATLYLWEYKPEYQDIIAEALEGKYGVPGNGRLEEELCLVSSKIAKEYWGNHQQGIREEFTGSPFEQMDENSLRVSFCETVAISIAYILLSRCGLHPEKHFQPESFQGILNFNTQRLIRILGAAVNQSGDVLHLIAVTILDYERGKQPAQAHNNTSEEKGDDNPSAFRNSAAKASSQPSKPTVQEIYSQYKPVIKDFLLNDVAYRNACKNSDRENAELEGEAAVKRAALSIADLRFLKVYYDVSEFHNSILREIFAETYPMLAETQNPPVSEAEQDGNDTLADAQQPAVEDTSSEDDTNLDDTTAAEQVLDNALADAQQPATKETYPEDNADSDDITAVGNTNPDMSEAEEASTECDLSEADTHTDSQIPLAAPEPEAEVLPPVDYQIGDTVYLEGTAYQITDIGLFDVQLRDPSLLYPVFRAESKDRFEDMLQRDPRNVARKQEIVLEPSEVREIPAAENFTITDDQLGTGGSKAKFANNMAAITVLKQIEAENRSATPEEQQILSQYVGWGGIPDAFDESKTGWEKEYLELKEALTPEEYVSARASTLNAHYARFVP